MNPRVRPPAVAGSFYPSAADALAVSVEKMLAAATVVSGAPPKALVVPHAGYLYSGPIAASAYVQWRALKGTRPRVVLLGPAHYVGIRGLALPDAGAMQTPLGEVPIDAAGLTATSEAAHRREHSLEVQLPFLQQVLGDFTLVPLAVGDATRAEVASVLERLWDDARILISTDLSHFLTWEEARDLDARTAQAIVEMNAEAIGDDQACGCVGLRGFLDVARRRGLSARQLDLRNSGDTAGDRSRVVGYGAFGFYEEARA